MQRKFWGVLTGVRPSKIVHNYLDQRISPGKIRLLLQENYGLMPEKIELLLQICLLQRKFIPLPGERGTIGVYIGIPFCPSRCYYCSFPSYRINNYAKQVTPFLNSLFKEIEAMGNLIQKLDWRVETLYLGGGTPTVLSDQDLDNLFIHLKKYFDFSAIREITVEAGRPETINETILSCLIKHGVNRISINPQTMQDKTLDYIGRKHTVKQIIEAVKLVRKYTIPILNMDLIMGLPGEGVKEAEDSLNKVIDLNPENITLHTLALKRATYWKEQGKNPNLPGDETVQEMVYLSQSKLKEAGYIPYYLYRQKNILGGLENTGYCLEGKECLYNIQMMEDRNTILGLGVGAMTKLVKPSNFTVCRKPNPKDPFNYEERLAELIKNKTEFLLNGSECINVDK
ncbi:MAG TPA: coproporphyrinogen dehydrogenase HemZ [Clostridia bacterium]|nr:coproporphyrinogen dehydrogenase HemZ [Clostridia bacterium]